MNCNYSACRVCRPQPEPRPSVADTIADAVTALTLIAALITLAVVWG